MVETAPGMIKMSNPPCTHDDVLTAIGLVVADLVSKTEVGVGSIWSLVGYDRNAVPSPGPRRRGDAHPEPDASRLHPSDSGPLPAVYVAHRNRSMYDRK
jgi:hypothetical protein